MTGIEIFTTAFGVLGTGCAIFFGLAAFRRNSKSDDAAEGKKDGVLLTEIGYVKAGIDDIKRKQEKEDDRHVQVVARLTAVEASAKQAHHRLDSLENKIGRQDDK